MPAVFDPIRGSRFRRPAAALGGTRLILGATAASVAKGLSRPGGLGPLSR